MTGNAGAMSDESGDDDRRRDDTDSSSEEPSPAGSGTDPEGGSEPGTEAADTDGPTASADADGRTAGPEDDVEPESETRRPSPAGESAADRPRPEEGSESNDLVDFVREVLTSVGTVLLIGGVLFALSGVWPPLVAVESGSMEPHMFRGDLVFVAENGRYAPDDAAAGVVTHRQGRETGYWSFGDHGNVIVYQPDGRAGTPVIHRARMYVEEGENWVQRANPEYLGGADTCAENAHCPADHSGFITKGDDNRRYDQVGSAESGTLTGVVRPAWVRGNAKVRVPKLGCVRLELSGIGCEYPVVG